VVVPILTPVQGDPVCTRFPPFWASYHLIVPLQPLAVKVKVPAEHELAGEAVAVGEDGAEPVMCKVATLLEMAEHPLEVTTSLK
jgi:hypothetical protein